MEPHTRSTAPDPSARTVATLAFFCLVFFLRLWLVREWGSPLPYWDQWDGEALGLYRPWLDGTFHWEGLLRPHNEHRIVLPRLVDLGMLAATGRWQTWWQLVFNAALNAATATLLFLAFRSHLDRVPRRMLAVVFVALFATPSGWQNALWGFQSGSYLANTLGCLSVVLLLKTEPLHARWWAGCGAALLAMGSQAPGAFAPLAAALVLGSSALCRRNLDWRGGAAAGILAALSGYGLLSTAPVPAHAYLQATSVPQFLAVAARGLAYPHIEHPCFCILLQGPLLWLVYTLLRRRRAPNTAESCALALGVIGLLNAVAIAHSRGAGLPDGLPLSRYHDSLLLGTVGNLAALLMLCTNRRYGTVIAAAWSAFVLLGLAVLAAGSLTFNLPVRAEQNRIAQAMFDAYAGTKDPGVFLHAQPVLRPHPNPGVVVATIDDPLLRPILPPECLGGAGKVPWIIAYSPWFAAISASLLVLRLLATAPRRQN